jgi:hypothetical protein
MTGAVKAMDISVHVDLQTTSDSAAAMLTFVVLIVGWTWGLWASHALVPARMGNRRTACLGLRTWPAGFVVVVGFDGRQGTGRRWRRCLRCRLGWGWASLNDGVVWAIWHLPPF